MAGGTDLTPSQEQGLPSRVHGINALMVTSALQPLSGISLVSHLSGEASPRLCCRKSFPDAFLRGKNSFVMFCKAPKLRQGWGRERKAWLKPNFKQEL